MEIENKGIRQDINKDIKNDSEYREKVISILTLRQLVVVIVVTIVMLLVYLFFGRYLGIQGALLSSLYVVFAFPFCFFFKHDIHNGLNAEQFIKILYRFYFEQDRHLHYRTEDLFIEEKNKSEKGKK